MSLRMDLRLSFIAYESRRSFRKSTLDGLMSACRRKLAQYERIPLMPVVCVDRYGGLFRVYPLSADPRSSIVAGKCYSTSTLQ